MQDEPGFTLRGDPQEWFKHHISRLVNDSRARAEDPPTQADFLRQLVLEHKSRDAALAEYQPVRVSAEERGEPSELPPVKGLMSAWVPALMAEIATEQMQVSGVRQQITNTNTPT